MFTPILITFNQIRGLIYHSSISRRFPYGYHGSTSNQSMLEVLMLLITLVRKRIYIHNTKLSNHIDNIYKHLYCQAYTSL